MRLCAKVTKLRDEHVTFLVDGAAPYPITERLTYLDDVPPAEGERMNVWGTVTRIDEVRGFVTVVDIGSAPLTLRHDLIVAIDCHALAR